MSILTSRTELLTVSDLDWFHVVDVSDTTDSPQGTSKKIKKGTLFSAIGGGAWGEITGTLSDQTDLQTALDGKENSFSKNTGFNKNFGTTSGTVSQGNHTHTFASLTSKPTTIAGYGITDFNSLGDARWLGISATAANSTLFGGLGTGSFLRSDASDSTTAGTLTIGGLFTLENNGSFPFMAFKIGATSRNLLNSGNDLRWYYDGSNFGKIWHSENDGSGSGLDADLLRGLPFTSSGNRFGVIVPVEASGVMEIGRYLDFHTTNGDAGDYAVRLDAFESGTLSSTGSIKYTTFKGWQLGATPTITSFSNGSNSYFDLQIGDLFVRDSSTPRFTFSRTTGNLTATGTMTASAFYESSDRSLKTNIQPISDTFRTFERKDAIGKIRYGVIAQEVEKTNPELVNTDADGIKSVNYTDLYALKFAEQENKLQEQGEKIERLEALVEQLLKG